MIALDHDAIVSLIPPHARSLLELGCGAGSVGERFKKIQPQCRYFGIDRDREQLQQAARVLDRAAVEADWNLDLSRYGIMEVDCILIHSGYWQGGEREIADRLDYFCKFLSVKGQIILLTGEDRLRSCLDAALTELPMLQCSRRNLGEVTVIRLFRSQAPSLTIHTFAAEPVTARIRIMLPDQYCSTDPTVRIREDFCYPDVSLLRDDEQICIMQRCLIRSFEQADDALTALAGTHRLLINEFDDAPFLWTTDPEYGLFVGVHVIQTSTPALADVFREYNPYVLTFENHVASLPPLKRPDFNSDCVTIFFGAINRREDWQTIMPAINSLIQQYGSRLSFLVAGDREFYDALATENREYLSGGDGSLAPYEAYLSALHRADIALLPLRDTPFNRLKSDLKFIEAAAQGTVVLASPTVYAHTVRDGRTGFLYHDQVEFRQLLSLLIEHPLLRWETAQLAYAYVRENRLLADHYEERIDAYRELLRYWEELERERQRRMIRLRQQVAIRSSSGHGAV